MRRHGKKYTAARAQVGVDRTYSIEDAVPLVQKVKYAKFDETVELTLRLGVDPKHADQMVRGTVVLPHGLGKTKRVLAIAGGEKQKEAQEAGADFVGGEELVEKIMGGWTDYDAVVATPDMSTKEATKLMAEHQVRRLPVVDGDRLVGIGSIGDLAVKEGKDSRSGDTLQSISEGVKERG